MTKSPSLFMVASSSTISLLLLLAILSLSPAWAGAFNSGISSPIIHQRRHRNVDGSKSLSFTRDTASSPSFSSLSRLMFLRGGGDEDTVGTSDETVSLDASQRTNSYGTAQDEEATSPDSVEMTDSHPAAAVEVESASSTATKVSPLLSVMAPVTAVLKVALNFYTQQLTARPMITKSLTAGIIFGLSDWCAQLIEEKDESAEGKNISPIVLSRILSAFLVGLLFFGPAANLWYSMIFKALPSTSLISTLQKAALGQIFFGPAFTAVFFGAGMIQSGTFTLGAWVSKIRTDLPGVWASGLGYWPLVDFISYKVVPVQWIPLFVNSCSFVWTIYLSLVANRGKEE